MMDDMINAIRIRDLLKKYKFRFKNNLGQNFLADDRVLKDIIDASSVTKGDSVLEVGSGTGILTLQLAKHAGKVLTIEVDDGLIGILREVFSGTDNIRLYHGDALKMDLAEAARGYLAEPITICANLPYYITTPLIVKFFKCGLEIKNIVLMVQKEVALRMDAHPGTADYGALSLLVQYYSAPKIVSYVPSSCFIPHPKVDSAIIKLAIRRKPPVEVYSESLFFNVIRSSFNQRRKMLSNSLKPVGITKEKLMAACGNSSIDPSRRGETLSIQEFALLSNEIYKLTVPAH